jgi:hypothetical protein
MMNVVTKRIRKLMGWCPNATNTDAGSWISPSKLAAYNHSGGDKAGRSGGEKNRNNISRMKRIGLLFASIGSLLATLSNRFLPNGEAGWLVFYIGIILFVIGLIIYIKF